MTEKTEEKKSNKAGIILLLLLALGLGGLAGYLYQEKTELEVRLVECGEYGNQLETEKNRVISELEAMMAKYDTLSASNEQMSEELLAEKEKVAKLLKEAKDKNWTIAKLKKETETLRQIMVGYVHTIDSLNTLNVQLKEENTQITEELTDQKKKYNELEGVKEDLATKVKIGSRLRAMDITVITQRVKSNNVYRETTKADKTDKIKVCFTLDKNEITKPGKKDIYIRIIAPDATVLPCDEANCKFNFSGVSGEYSMKREIEYSNTELDKCFYYDVLEEIPVGNYIMELYSDEADIGKTTFELK